MKPFRVYRQQDSMDCGPSCLRMIAAWHGKLLSAEYIRKACYLSKSGVSLLALSEGAEKIGFRTLAAEVSFEQFVKDVPLPCLIHWNKGHFVVIPPQRFRRRRKIKRISLADPAQGLVHIDTDTFLSYWTRNDDNEGVVLMMEPGPGFSEEDEEPALKKGLSFLLPYIRPYRKLIVQLFLGMLLGSALALLFPFLTQSLVDYGINHQNMGFITLVLVSQLVLFIGNTLIEMIRSWILLHMNSRINISILSDFLLKLMKLPVRYFDSKRTGDLIQRIYDHERIEHFLSVSTLNTVFSFSTLIVFSVVLGIYSSSLLLIFLAGSILSVVWITLFLRWRRKLDYKRFLQQSNNQNALYELINGMQEIKLNNCETRKRWEWERIQARLFRLNVKNLSIGQYQQMGNLFFLQAKNIFISFVAAREVLNGQMTLGMMLAVSYIIGQMNSPIDHLLEFFKSAQDAKISIERLGEVHQQENEENDWHDPVHSSNSLSSNMHQGDLRMEQVSFGYGGPSGHQVLKNIDLHIPEGKVTAIVGSSGSGKTTLLKMLLRFYEPITGRITVNGKDLKQVSPRLWRERCGVVMQEGFVFSDTIADNIAVSDEVIDERKLQHAVRVANIEEHIEQLPAGYGTKIGPSGEGISTGQKQRLLIARAVYKNPAWLFFDEATSALDANNEKIIMENLQQFFKGRTVVIIAHRLSTVKHADQIIVLEQGEIVETGDHQSLSRRKGRYFELVKNQLELDV